MPTKHLRHRVAQWALVFALGVPLSPLWMGAPQPALSAAAPLGATVSVLSLPVEVAYSGHGSSFEPAADGQTLLAGDTVRTGPGGIALITFFDGSESQLGGESQVHIEQVKANPAPQIAFLQTAGVTVNHVVPMPAEGSFRTDTPAATGLVRGTSYIVIVGSAGTCGPAGDQPCAASIILLTDRNGHVGRVDVTANASSAPAVQLSKAGDAAAASSVAAAATQIDPAVLAHLESVAHVRSDPNASLTTEQDARAIAATLAPLAADPPVAAVAPTPTADESNVDTRSPKVSNADLAPSEPQPTMPAPAAPADDHRTGSSHGTSGEAQELAPALAPSPTSAAAPPRSPAPPPTHGHSDSVAPPQVVPSTTAATPPTPHDASSGSNSEKSDKATTPPSLPKPVDSAKVDQPAKPADSASTATLASSSSSSATTTTTTTATANNTTTANSSNAANSTTTTANSTTTTANNNNSSSSSKNNKNTNKNNSDNSDSSNN